MNLLRKTTQTPVVLSNRPIHLLHSLEVFGFCTFTGGFRGPRVTSLILPDLVYVFPITQCEVACMVL